MDFLTIGNLGGYIKTLKLESQWALKRQTGEYNAKGTSLEDWLDGSRFQAEEPAGDRGDDVLRKIHQKLDTGGTLTRKERDYLREHDPEAYRELVNQEREQRAYEQALRRCKTRQEAQQLQINRINASLARVRSVEHDSHIPLSEKLKIAMAEKQRVDRVAESTRKFVTSGEFDKLPTREEELQAVADELNAGVAPPKRPGDTDKEQPDRPAQEAHAPKAEAPSPEAESPEARKVRRAKARAAYAALQTPDQPIVDTVDRRA